jgi:hypothetical protein
VKCTTVQTKQDSTKQKNSMPYVITTLSR